MMVDFEAFR